MVRQDSVNVANEAALLVIEILKEPCKIFRYQYNFRGDIINAKKSPNCQEYDDILQDK
jgi:hypothetical protein